MKKNVIVMSLFCVAFVLVVSACRGYDKREKTETVNVTGKEEKLVNRFVDRKTTAISKVITTDGKEYGRDEKIVLLYTGYDCQSCVDKGFEIIKRIDSLYPVRKTYIITSQSNIGFDQKRNEYYKYIYNDHTELIRKELDFVPTPMIIKLNREDIIVKVFFPVTNSNIYEAVNKLSLNAN
jgi:hypothetical protein